MRTNFTPSKSNSTVYPLTNSGLLEILSNMLQFNPNFRQSPKQLLKNKLFDRIRNPEMERPAPFKISLDVDEEGSFDYENCKSLKFGIKDFKNILINEI